MRNDMDDLAKRIAFGSGQPGEAPAAQVPDGIFSPRDLEAFVPPAEEFIMPGGKRVWVHALDTKRVTWLNVLAVKDLQRMQVDNEEERALVYRQRAMIYQVIACSRVGAGADDPPVFAIEHAEQLHRRLPWEVVRRICETSDRLGGDADTLQKAVADFFGKSASFLQTLLSQWSTDSQEPCRAALERFASCVSLIAQRRTLGSSDVGMIG